MRLPAELQDSKQVNLRSGTLRFVALLLLLFSAVEIGICELSEDTACDYVTQNDRQSHDRDSSACDNCICCCAHVIPAPAFAFVPYLSIIPAQPEEQVDQPLLMPSAIDHPPQLS